MDFIIFGDDWGKHPSTTQHLANNLNTGDRFLWVNSIGMRSPDLNMRDCSRIANRFLSFLVRNKNSGKKQTAKPAQGLISLQRFLPVTPFVFPYHGSELIRKCNRFFLNSQLKKCSSILALKDPIVITSNPLAVYYLEEISYSKACYLRLDLYEKLPGVDGTLVKKAEPAMFNRADAIFYTARELQPIQQDWLTKSMYLPQGVDIENFSQASLLPSGKKVLGFFGIIAEWIDFRLIAEVAKAAPDWQLEFVGAAQSLPESVKKIDNITWHPAVPYGDLPQLAANWTCAWVPFVVNSLTESVNPLKIREYLAMGLPALSTPLPELQALSERYEVSISQHSDEIVAWMRDCLQRDSIRRRTAIRKSMENETWEQRVGSLKKFLKQCEKR